MKIQYLVKSASGGLMVYVELLTHFDAWQTQNLFDSYSYAKFLIAKNVKISFGKYF